MLTSVFARRHSSALLPCLLPFVLLAACSDSSTKVTAPVVPAAPVSLASANAPQAAIVGTPFSYDATKGDACFADPSGKGLTYAVTFTPSANGLVATGGKVSGVPAATGITGVTITATDKSGATASNSFSIVSFASGLSLPSLPATSLLYRDAAVPIPAHFLVQGPGGPVSVTDNSPADNAITDAGATLGRVLFYDRRLSANDQTACASCHQQQFGFSDTARLSRGFQGGLTGRHAMALGNARYYQRGHFFWDERANTLEDQVVQPIQNTSEMGMTLDHLETKLTVTSYYPVLFQAAFGTNVVTRDRIARALAQFTRSLVAGNSKFDRAFAVAGPPNFAGTFTATELQGQQLFDGQAGCGRCHATNAHVADDIHNTGLDATITDVGAGNGRFKVPSLRNVALRAPYMHDGRFRTLADVVEFYNSGVQNNPGLDNRLRPNGQVQRLNLSQTQKAALVAYLGTFTDSTFIANPRFASPFP